MKHTSDTNATELLANPLPSSDRAPLPIATPPNYSAMRRFSLPLLLVCFAPLVFSITPTAPGPGEVFREGSDCTIQWTPDAPQASARTFKIDLMSGSNNNMSLVTNVAKGLNPSNATLSPYKWTCPEVEPNSAIYFYQFSYEPAGPDAPNQWTTRFTVADGDGATEPPENASQPSGEPIPWGVGRLESSPSPNRANATGSSSASSASYSASFITSSGSSIPSSATSAPSSASPTSSPTFPPASSVSSSFSGAPTTPPPATPSTTVTIPLPDGYESKRSADPELTGSTSMHTHSHGTSSKMTISTTKSKAPPSTSGVPDIRTRWRNRAHRKASSKFPRLTGAGLCAAMIAFL